MYKKNASINPAPHSINNVELVETVRRPKPEDLNVWHRMKKKRSGDNQV